jgi:hypothetical protein
MKTRRISHIGYVLFVSLIVLAFAAPVFPQGKGHGAAVGGGRGSGAGPGNVGGAPSGVGVDRGLGNASDRSGGRSDNGLGNASEKSKGRSDAGLDRARMASDNMRRADDDLQNHPGIPRVLHTNANNLRSGYQAALATDPGLKFGEYVSATRVSQNLHPRFPNVTRDAILAGLASGRSLGRTLQDLGLSEHEAKDAKKAAEREIKEARRQ